MRQLAFLATCSLLAPLHARAQEARVAEPTPHMSPALGLHYGSPLRFSVAGGVLVDVSERRNDGIVAVIEPGQQGTAVSTGYFRMFGRFGSGYSLRVAALRTVGEPWNASPNTTYAGVEGNLMLAFGVGARMGYLRRTSRRVDDSHDNLATVGVLIGI